jgi:antitoxin HicB
MANKPRDAKSLTALDAVLDLEGTREEFQAVAIKEVLAWQIGQAMKSQGLSRKRMAERMGTSRSQIGRLLDPSDGNVTLATLQRDITAIDEHAGMDRVP